MDKTYAETRDEQPIDWFRAIDGLEAGTLSEEETSEFLNKAWDWPTCACGNQCAIIPRGEADDDSFLYGEPKDDTLSKLGYQFPSYLEVGEYDRARECLAAIEARSAVLIQQELAKLNP